MWSATLRYKNLTRTSQGRKITGQTKMQKFEKSINKKLSKPNPKFYKEVNTIQPIGVSSRNTRFAICHLKINQYNLPHSQNKVQKNHRIISRDVEKSFDKSYHPFMIKSFSN